MDSKEGASKFHPRHRTSEMFLSLQAFDFGVEEDVSEFIISIFHLRLSLLQCFT